MNNVSSNGEWLNQFSFKGLEERKRYIMGVEMPPRKPGENYELPSFPDAVPSRPEYGVVFYRSVDDTNPHRSDIAHSDRNVADSYMNGVPLPVHPTQPVITGPDINTFVPPYMDA